MDNPIIAAIDKFYSDTSRSPAQTLAGLLDSIEHIKILVETLQNEGVDGDEAFNG